MNRAFKYSLPKNLVPALSMFFSLMVRKIKSGSALQQLKFTCIILICELRWELSCTERTCCCLQLTDGLLSPPLAIMHAT